MFNIPDTIAVYELGGGDVGSAIKTTCRRGDLCAKYLDTNGATTNKLELNSQIDSSTLLRLRRWG